MKNIENILFNLLYHETKHPMRDSTSKNFEFILKDWVNNSIPNGIPQVEFEEYLKNKT